PRKQDRTRYDMHLHLPIRAPHARHEKTHETPLSHRRLRQPMAARDPLLSSVADVDPSPGSFPGFARPILPILSILFFQMDEPAHDESEFTRPGMTSQSLARGSF